MYINEIGPSFRSSFRRKIEDYTERRRNGGIATRFRLICKKIPMFCIL
jgi:hypothetical protein